MKKRILSMALVLCMCLGLLPTAAFAAGEPQKITTVELTGFTYPVYGESPDFELSVPEDAHYHFASSQELEDKNYESIGTINGIDWNGPSGICMNEDSIFANDTDEVYSMTLFLMPDPGYEFAASVSATIDGETSLLKSTNSKETSLCIRTKYLAAIIPETSTATVTFKVENGTWEDSTTADKTVEVTLTNGKGTLDAAQVPTGMQPAEGYEGGEWMGLNRPNTTTDGIIGDVTYTYSFSRKLIPITEIDLTDLAMPVGGEHPDYEAGMPADAPYRFFSDEELKSLGDLKWNVDGVMNGIRWFHNDASIQPTDSFTTGNQYAMELYLSAKDGYKFPVDGNYNFTINGEPVAVDSMSIFGKTQMSICIRGFIAAALQQISITSIEATSDIQEKIQYGNSIHRDKYYCNSPDFTETSGKPAYFNPAGVNVGYEQWNEDKNAWEPCEAQTGKELFTEGKYRYRAQVRVEDTADTHYVLSDGCTVKVDGQDWGTLQDIVSHSVGVSWGYIYSPAVTVTKPAAETKSTVTFKVENGTWKDGTSADKTVEVALADGKGTLDVANVPTGMKPAEGYEGGAWDVTPVTTADGITGNVTYTYSFSRKLIPITEVALTGFTEPVYGATPDFEMSVPENAPYHFATQEEMAATGHYINIEQTVNGIWWVDSHGNMTQTDTFTDPDARYYAQIILMANQGYVFAGNVTVHINGDSSFVRIINTHRGGTDIGITTSFMSVTAPAQSKATVTFKVENGTWMDGTSADKTVEVALADGKGNLDVANVPTGMKPIEGYEGGTWDVTPNTTTDGITGNVTYTYSFTPHTHVMVPHTKVPATCTENGTKEYWHCTGCNKNFADADGKTGITDLTIPATGHSWGTTTYEWSQDGKTCKATRICQNDDKFKETADATVTRKVTLQPTETKMGQTTYTAKFSVDWAASQTTVMTDIPAKGHIHTGTLVEGKAATCTADGWKAYYKCQCGKFFEDEACKTAIPDLVAWKTGAGKQSDVTAHTYEWIIDREATETTEGAKHQHCTVCGYNAASVTIPVIKVPVETVEKVVAKPLNKVPEGLKNTDFNTVEKIQQAMEKVVLTKIGEQNTGNEQKTTIYDATLMITEDGVTRPATKEEVEARGGITIMIPYPAGTNNADYVFTVAHMLTMDMAGMKAGDIETPEITLTDAGLQVTLKGLSPVMVGYSKKAAAPAPTEPTTPGATAPTTPATTKPNPSTGVKSPQTGDESNILLWTLLGMVSACGMIRIVLVKKKRSSIK